MAKDDISIENSDDEIVDIKPLFDDIKSSDYPHKPQVQNKSTETIFNHSDESNETDSFETLRSIENPNNIPSIKSDESK
jgi:hypothetical protein